MTQKVLCVDDDPNILGAFQRSLRKFHLEVALGGEQALELIQRSGPFAVVVSDMRMPGMDGIQFLTKVRERAPNTVRMMLTGNADQQTAIDAVNQGHIFRFLTKPCTPELLAMSLNAGIEQYRLIMAEKELLEQTLTGGVQMLIDLLAIVHPFAFSRASRVKQLATRIAAELQLENAWQVAVAAMLSHVGCVVVPEDTLKKFFRGQSLTSDESAMIHSHPKIGCDLVSRIPRMEPVAEIINYQEKLFNGDGPPKGTKSGHDIPIGARVLKVALDFDRLVARGEKAGDACSQIDGRSDWYDPEVLRALRAALRDEIKYQPKAVNIDELAVHMTMDQEVVSRGGFVLIAEGQEVTPYLLDRLRNLAAKGVITGPFKVQVPANFGGLG